MDEINTLIGKNLKAIRTERKLSLDKVSELTEVSKTMLGQIERGETNPTVNTIWKIATGLQLSFSSLIQEKESAVETIARADMVALPNDEASYQVYPLVQFQPDKQFELFMVEIEAGSSHRSPAHNPGVEEYIVVNQGTMQLETGNQQIVVEKSGFIHFKADNEHIYRNIGSDLLVLSVWINYGR